MGSFYNFADIRILVAGDLMLDRYWWGTVDRISPEAPVPIVRLNRTSTVLGGAANVAANVVALGARASLIGVRGKDNSGDELCDLLLSSRISPETIFSVDDRPTSVKTRIVAHSQQVVRVDEESNVPLTETAEKSVLSALPKLVEESDLILISDYAKGFLSENVISELIRLAREGEKIILVDPKGINYNKYRGASIITPNVKEAAEATHLHIESDDSLNKAAWKLIGDLSLNAIIITRGEDGMTLFSPGLPAFHVTSHERHVFDVTGAGDTVIATLAVCMAAGFSLKDSVTVANIAAGIVVAEVGTTVIKKEKLLTELAAFPSISTLSMTSP
jgi:rfaE bifunctional protein kinase chain/domain